MTQENPATPITIDVDVWLIKYNTRNINDVIFAQDSIDLPLDPSLGVYVVPLIDSMSEQPVGRVILTSSKEGIKATQVHTQEYMRETILRSNLNNQCSVGSSIGNVVTSASLVYVIPTTDKVSWQEKKS